VQISQLVTKAALPSSINIAKDDPLWFPFPLLIGG
jgi:hypothetical protein